MEGWRGGKEKDSPTKGEAGIGRVRMTPQTLPCSAPRRTRRSHLGFIFWRWENCSPQSGSSNAGSGRGLLTWWRLTLHPVDLDSTASTACDFPLVMGLHLGLFQEAALPKAKGTNGVLLFSREVFLKYTSCLEPTFLRGEPLAQKVPSACRYAPWLSPRDSVFPFGP